MHNIVIASDSNYLHLVATCIVSLFETNPDGKFHIHLLSNGIGEVDLDALKIIMERYQGHLSVYPIDDLRERLAINVPSTISLTSYARLFVASILPPDLDKILYIDCDIMFNGSIRQLFDIDFADNLIGGVLDPLISHTYKKELKISKNEAYINAGVLMIPLQRWRREGMEQKFIDYLIANGGRVHHHDQGIINAVCSERKKILPPQFNVMSNSLCYPWKKLYEINTPFYNHEEFNNGISAPIIIHFTGITYRRPWIMGCTHPYVDRFLQYRANTTYENMPLTPDDQSKLQHLERTLYRLLPFEIFKWFMQAIYYMSYFKHLIRK